MAIPRWAIGIAIVVLIVGSAWATSGRWLPLVKRAPTATGGHAHGHEAEGEHGGHDHSHAGHSEANAIKLSEKALKNVGFQPVTVRLGQFERTVAIPAIVVEQPGRTQLKIVAPMGGVVTEIRVIRGEAIEPDSPMFNVRLTHEELVVAQRDYLQALQTLDVVNREIKRLESVGDGVVPGKRILEQQYEKQKLEASLSAYRQALLLHGLNEPQINDITTSRQLLRSQTIRAPKHDYVESGCTGPHLYHVQHLPVFPGQQVETGQELAVLADHCQLYVEGRAFEDDAAVLRKAIQENWNITASLLVGERETDAVEGLKVLYLADSIDPDSRAFRFYLGLSNQVALDKQASPERRFIEWRFKPGQRMMLRIPVEKWDGRIVLPVDGVVDEGAEMYVYRRSGDHFDRVPVRAEYRDRNSVVVANDGSLFPGDVVAGKGAYQMHLALKNKAGGGVDPHAGHQH